MTTTEQNEFDAAVILLRDPVDILSSAMEYLVDSRDREEVETGRAFNSAYLTLDAAHRELAYAGWEPPTGRRTCGHCGSEMPAQEGCGCFDNGCE